MRKISLALNSIRRVQRSSNDQTGLLIRERAVWERFVKRSLDIIASLVVLIIGFPFLIAVAMLIKLTSKGPIFFRQARVGENGEEFILFKFRTMKPGSDDSLHKEFTRSFIQGLMSQSNLDGDRSSIYKLTNDPRITAVGGFLRKTSLDELPQFINILKGEMTIVGPRPPLHYEYDCYDDWHKLRLKVRPGLTGLWQVSGRSSVPFHEMVMLDLHYIENWSMRMDLKIMMQTIPVMLSGTGGL